MLKIDNLTVTFNIGTPVENKVIRNLNLSIEEGQFVTVIGSNGAGKSTLLNLISGDVIANGGSISIDGLNVTQHNAWQRAPWVARVFQDPMAGTCENLTIEQNMALAYARGESRGLRQSINKKCRNIFKERLSRLGLGLENRLNDRIGLLSGGQRQAISLLMASLKPSSILLLDEHTAALDPKTEAFVLNLTQEIISENNLTVLMVTHNMRQALDFGNRTIMLHQGDIILDVSDAERNALDIPQLLQKFEQTRGKQLADDALLLG